MQQRWSFRDWFLKPIIDRIDKRDKDFNAIISNGFNDIIQQLANATDATRKLTEVFNKMADNADAMKEIVSNIDKKVDELKSEVGSLGDLNVLVEENSKLIQENKDLQTKVNELLTQAGVDAATIQDLNTRFDKQNTDLASAIETGNSIITKLGELDDELPGDTPPSTEGDNSGQEPAAPETESER